MTESWPPPPTPDAPWQERRLRCADLGDAGGTFIVRPVRLWGREVLIDEAHRVYCRGCASFLSVRLLGRIDNTHPVGLPYRAEGQLLRVDLLAEDDGSVTPEGF